MSMTRNRSKILVCVLIILLIPFLSISSVRNSMGTTVYQIWQIVSVMFLFILMFTAASEIKLNWAVELFLLYQSVILLSSFFNQGFSLGILTVIMAAILLFTVIQSSYYYEIVSAICVIVVLSAIINLPIMLPKLSNMDAEFFIGGKNALGMFLIPGAFLLLINSMNSKKKFSKRDFLAIGLCLISVFIGSSGTGVVVSVLAVVLMGLSAKIKPRKWIYILVILVFYAIVLLFSEDFFVTKYWLSFTELLGKDSTLTSRTTIWSIEKEIISENWFLGSGRGTEISYVNTWGERQIIYEPTIFFLRS